MSVLTRYKCTFKILSQMHPYMAVMILLKELLTIMLPVPPR